MKAVGAFIVFLLLAIAWTWPARRWPMVFDDLHLVRTFSGSELAAFEARLPPAVIARLADAPSP